MHNDNTRHYILLWFLGLYLRLAVLIVPPLSLLLEAELGFSTGDIALATSLPSLLIGGCALIAAWLVSRFGAVATVATGLAVMAAGSALRSVPDGISLFLLATVIMGGGIALMQIGMPLLARSWVPTHIGRASAVYANGLLVGELLGAGLTGPLAEHVLGEHWLLSFALWVLPVPLIVLALLAHRRPAPEAAPAPAAAVTVAVGWRDPLLWRCAILLGCGGALFYGGNIFLPQILAQSDRVHLLTASLSALNGTQLISSAVLMVYSDRLLGQRWPLLMIIGSGLLAIPALLLAPGTSVVWAAGLLGLAASALFVLALTLPAWLVPMAQVARLAAGVTLLGNVLTFLMPVLGGWAVDYSGSPAAGFLPVVAISLLALWASGGLRRRH